MRKNPNWTRDETILALDLYFELGRRVPSADDVRVRELSALLKRNPMRPSWAVDDSYRNPTSVAFKLSNLHSAAGEVGFENNSKLDRELWAELGNDPDRVRTLARTIEIAIDDPLIAGDGADDTEPLFAEGELVTRTHRRRERKPKLRATVLRDRRHRNAMACDACGVAPYPSLGDLGLVMFEVHHLVPLSAGGRTSVRAKDTALLCASCHRLVHALISARGEWIDIATLRAEIGS